jgi:hypothetical protein
VVDADRQEQDVVAAAEGARAAEEAVKRARPGSADVAWRPDRAPDCFNSDASVALRVSSGMRGDDPQARTLLNNMMDAQLLDCIGPPPQT